MKNFKSHIYEMSHKDLNSKFKGLDSDTLQKMAKDNRKYSPKQREEIQREIEARSRVNEETGGAALAGAPGNNTRSGPGMGDDKSLHMKKMRMFKSIYRRHRGPNIKK